MTISKKQKTKRATGLDRRTKEETAKENQMTAPEIPDRSGTSDIPVSLWGEINYTWIESSSQLTAVFSLL